MTHNLSEPDISGEDGHRLLPPRKNGPEICQASALSSEESKTHTAVKLLEYTHTHTKQPGNRTERQNELKDVPHALFTIYGIIAPKPGSLRLHGQAPTA